MRRPDKNITFFADKELDIPFKHIKEFSREMIKEICENEDGVALPGNLGVIQMVGTKEKALDRKNTILLGKPVFYQNYHTEGFSFRPRWNFTRRGHESKSKNLKRKLFKYTLLTFKPYDLLKDNINRYIAEDKWFNWLRKESKI